MTIYAALLAALETLEVGSPPLPIDTPEPEETFEAPGDRKYLTVNDATNTPFWQGLAAGRIDQGILQVTVVWPKNQGLEGPKAAADEVIAHFWKGRIFASGGVRVKVQRQPYHASPIIEPDKVRIPVLIPWVS